MFADTFSLLSWNALSKSRFLPEGGRKCRFFLMSALLVCFYKIEEKWESKVKY